VIHRRLLFCTELFADIGYIGIIFFI